jgi:hypothetical protein
MERRQAGTRAVMIRAVRDLRVVEQPASGV